VPATTDHYRRFVARPHRRALSAALDVAQPLVRTKALNLTARRLALHGLDDDSVAGSDRRAVAPPDVQTVEDVVRRLGAPRRRGEVLVARCTD
jgi:hypothetical protein